MDTREKHKVKDKLYSYNPAGYCGVFVSRKVMKKLAGMTTKFEQEVREVLKANIDDLYCYEWNLAYPNKIQTAVYFATKGDLNHRIDLFRARQPEVHSEVYLAAAFGEDAKAIIKQIEEEGRLKDKVNDK